MADPFDLTPMTKLVAPDVLNSALERISSQALWLLLSLDRYGWRVEYDAIRLLLAGQPDGDGGFYRQHAPLLALGHHFALTDKLWRLVYGMRAHRAGREFLNTEDGYLTGGYKYHRKLADAFANVRISSLRRDQVEDFIAGRAAQHRRSAKNELEFLKRVLRDARGRGQRVDEAIFGIDPIRPVPREGRALTVEQLHDLASWFPEHSKRLVLLAGMVGARQRVWFEMTDDLLDLANGRLSIPAWLSKNGKPHHVYLTDLESQLFREQLLVRAPGTPLVFPSPTGKQWTESGFRQRVWEKGVAAALANDRAVDGRRSVFEDFNFHLLRHTACSLMAMAGMDPAVAAERASHTDGGALFLRKYRHLYEGEARPGDAARTARPCQLGRHVDGRSRGSSESA